MTIRLEGYEDLLKRITTLAQLKQLQAAVKAAALHVKGKIARYPAARHGPAVPDARSWTAKQRRGFFAKLRAGEIEVPYRRGQSASSESLGRKWHIATSNAGLTATVANNVSYGPLVQSNEKQTIYHQITGWKTTEDVAAEERQIVVDLLVQELMRAVNG